MQPYSLVIPIQNPTTHLFNNTITQAISPIDLAKSFIQFTPPYGAVINRTNNQFVLPAMYYPLTPAPYPPPGAIGVRVTFANASSVLIRIYLEPGLTTYSQMPKCDARINFTVVSYG